MDPAADKPIAPADPIALDLVCEHHRGEKYLFQVRLHFDALGHKKVWPAAAPLSGKKLQLLG
jgi:hypothetical protein